MRRLHRLERYVTHSTSAKGHLRFWLLLIGLLAIAVRGSGQSTLLGNTGAIITPDAYLQPDATLNVGLSYLPKDYFTIGSNYRDSRVIHVSLVFLPFVEVMLGTVQPYGKNYGIGDRTAAFRFRLFKESRHLPQIVLGTQDPFGVAAQDWAQRFCALYVVGSKSLQWTHGRRLSLHLGHGVDWLKAGQHYLVGTFGGVGVAPVSFVEGLLEYDTQHWNYGLRLSLWRFKVTAACLDGRDFCGSAQCNFTLPLFTFSSDPSPHPGGR